MKFLFGLLSLFLINKECESKKNDATTSNKTTTQVKKMSSEIIQDENIILSYTAITRGTNKSITVSKSETIVEDNTATEKKQTFKTSEKDWNEIVSMLSKIDTNNLKNLKAPSTKSHYDGALAATLKLSIDDNQISTQSFDHGNPPKEIEPLVNKLLSLIKTKRK